MLKVKANVQGLQELKKEIIKVETLLQSQKNSSSDFQQYIQRKVLETVNLISTQRLPGGETSQLYISNNKIRVLGDGFEVYNDTQISTSSEGYGGSFSIALAFEYGTGIVGQENPKPNAWQYNVNGHETGWVYFNEKVNGFRVTKGLMAYEIYRFSKEEIIKQMPRWINDYIERKVV